MGLCAFAEASVTKTGRMKFDGWSSVSRTMRRMRSDMRSLRVRDSVSMDRDSSIGRKNNVLVILRACQTPGSVLFLFELFHHDGVKLYEDFLDLPAILRLYRHK